MDDKISRAEHRERMRKRIRENGIDSLSEAEVVEYILMLCLPRSDIRGIAYELLNRFKTFFGIFEAEYDELIKIKGISDYTATFMTSFPGIVGIYRQSRLLTENRDVLHDVKEAAKYCETLFYGQKNEIAYVITLDTQRRVIQDNMLREGTINEVNIYVREVAEIAIRQKASGVIITHNHPGGNPSPSPGDINATKALFSALSLIQIHVVDHIVMSDSGYYSFRGNGLLDFDIPEITVATAATKASKAPAISRGSAARSSVELSVAAEKEQRPRKKKPQKNDPGGSQQPR